MTVPGIGGQRRRSRRPSFPYRILAFATALLLVDAVVWLAFMYVWRDGFFSNPSAAFYREALPQQVRFLTSWTVHVLLAVVLLVILILNLNDRLRRRHLRLHRTLGAVYLALLFPFAAVSLFIARQSIGGDTFFYFTVVHLSLVFLTVALAMKHIRRGNLRDHRLWMTRQFALLIQPVGTRRLVPLFLLVTTPGIALSVSAIIALLLVLCFFEWYYIPRFVLGETGDVLRPADRPAGAPEPALGRRATTRTECP